MRREHTIIMQFYRPTRHTLIIPQIIGLAWLLTTGCAHQQPPLDTRLKIRMATPSAAEHSQAPSGLEGDASRESATSHDVDKERFSSIEPLPAPPLKPAAANDADRWFDDTPGITVAADALELPDFVHHVFGKLLKVNYVLSDRLKNREKVSLNLDQPVSPRRLFRIVSRMLKEMKAEVREEDGIFYIGPQGSMMSLTLGRGDRLRDIPAVQGLVRQVIPLRYVKPDNIISALINIPEVQIGGLGSENALLVTGSKEGLAQVMQFLSVLDRPAMRGRFAAIARLNYRSSEEMIGILKKTLTVEGIPVADRTEGGGLHLIPLDTADMVAVFAAEKQWLARARYWIELMDKPAATEERRFFIYQPKNSRAADLLETLGQILGLSSQQGKGAEPAEKGMNLIQPASSMGRKNKPDARKVKTAAQEAQAVAAVGNGKVRLSVDATRNALIVYASDLQYRPIETLLKRLDIMPPQVLIEATVAEVTLVDDLQFGLEWYLKNSDGDQTTTAGTLNGLGLGSSGFNLATVLDSGKFNLLINALAKEELVQVLSSPRITVRDGNTASITVGTQVPVVTSETASVDTLDGVVRTFQYRSTGITLKLTPTVHARDVVTLEVEQEVSEPSASGGENPLILNRSLSTNVVATSGQTLAIGGLIKQSKGVTNTSVPLLGKVPLVGRLFRSTNKGSERTELVVLITPHIIQSTRQADLLRDQLFERFSHLKWDEE